MKLEFTKVIDAFNITVNEILALDDRTEKTTVDAIKEKVSAFAEMVKEDFVKMATDAEAKVSETFPIWNTAREVFERFFAAEITKAPVKYHSYRRM